MVSSFLKVLKVQTMQPFGLTFFMFTSVTLEMIVGKGKDYNFFFV